MLDFAFLALSEWASGNHYNYLKLFHWQITLYYSMTLLVFAVVLYLTVAVKAQDCNALAIYGNCDFYTQCIEQKLECGPNGYPLAYGNRYCNHFTDSQGYFTTGVSFLCLFL